MRRSILVLLVILTVLVSGCDSEEKATPRPRKPTNTPLYKSRRLKRTPRPTPTPRPNVVVTVNLLNVRKGPGTSYDIIGKVKKGDVLSVLGKSYTGTWLQVRTPDGKKGWVSNLYVEKTTSANPGFSTRRSDKWNAMAIKNANLRAGPGTNYPRIGSVKAGDNLKIVGKNQDGSWYKLSNGAWIAAFLVASAASNIPVVKIIPTPPPPPPSNTRGQSINIQPAPVCDCSGNHYNCGNFSSWSAAQRCYEYCKSVTGMDIHRLDRDHDGIACESLR